MKYRYDDPIEISYHELRALLFWAAFGVRQAAGGSYPDAADREHEWGIIHRLAARIRFHVGVPLFRKCS
jgi:hypothetical protein